MNRDDSDDPGAEGDHSGRSESIRQHLHRRHGATLDRLQATAASDAGTTEGRDKSGGKPATAVFASVVAAAVEVRVVGTNIPLERLPQFTGCYPQLSRLIVVTIAARSSATGRPVDLDLAESDAWASALAPDGFEHHMIRLGTLAGSTSRAMHYRYVLGGDHLICALDDHDATRLREGYRQ